MSDLRSLARTARYLSREECEAIARKALGFVTTIAHVGRRSGSSSTNQLDDESLRSAVETAERIARLAPEDPEFMPELGPQEYQPGRNWSDATASLDPHGRADAVRAITAPAASAQLVSTGFLDTRAGANAVA